jgi:spore maturation protein SpmB
MFANIDPTKSAIASILSALTGTWYNYCTVYFSSITLTNANTAFQHAAWTVAILAGIVSIINGMRQWKKTKNKNSQ